MANRPAPALVLRDGDRADPHASWMNMVETSFSMAERQAILRGSYRSVRDLTKAIRTYIDGWNDRAHPFTWTKTADQILAKANRPESSNARY